jgi:hypothetical protein
MNATVVTVAILTLSAITQMVPSLVLVMMDILAPDNHVPMLMNVQMTAIIATQMLVVRTVMGPSHALATTDMMATELLAQTKMSVTIARTIVTQTQLAQTATDHSPALAISDTPVMELPEIVQITTSARMMMVQILVFVRQR